MNKKIKFIVFFIMPVLAVLVFIFSLKAGAKHITLFDAIRALFGIGEESVLTIIRQIRLPRVIMAVTAGAGLAASGCVFQGILKNPLADPFTLGISGGAAFGASAGFVFGLAALSWIFIPFSAFAGALIAVLAVYALSMQRGFNSNSMILSGVIISYIFSSMVMLLFSVSKTNHIYSAFVWLMGNMSVFDERLLPAVVTIVIIGTLILCLSGNIINAVTLGGQKANTLGINMEKTVKIIFLLTSLITAACVSCCGVIGFVGLMMPHIMRKIVGGNNSVLIPASALAGCIFLPLCDTLSRTLFAPIEIPVGVITSIIGGVFFIVLMMRQNRNSI
ncbi:MAG: iron ABC transporter permease [Endomicrobia bacterium]|nr:iron ABC transporter permease [Endomicrobiia bacterium]